MQPIIILGLVAAVAITMSSGFLLQPTIQVWLQGVGFGAADAKDPVRHVSVDIDVDKVLRDPTPTAQNSGDETYDNVITECSFHIAAADILNQDMDTTDVDGVEEVICKLTESGKVKGEASITFLNGGKINCFKDATGANTQTAVPGYFCPSQHYEISLTNANWADGTPATIQEWTDVLIVVRGENPTNVITP